MTMTTDYRLLVDADISHESAEDMYDSLGWHCDWSASDPETGGERDSGQVVHPVCSIDDLDRSDDDLLADMCPDMCPEERDAYESALAYARGARDDMRAVEASLCEAVEAYEAGDVTACIGALDAARASESAYGYAPATIQLGNQLVTAVPTSIDRVDDEP